ncbi:MAG: Rieske (2Fe-2S) protein [bacterium]|nr:Rieske (2Fe-2S) protein [bacterium]
MADDSNSNKHRHVVAKVDELPPGERKIVKISGREIGVFNVHGEFYALRNVCPHKGGPLCKGRIRPLIVSAGGTDVAYEREDEILKCPWHQWEYDIKTGEALFGSNLRVRTYSVCQEDDDVVLYTDRRV